MTERREVSGLRDVDDPVAAFERGIGRRRE
jgi:hypothetical protein